MVYQVERKSKMRPNMRSFLQRGSPVECTVTCGTHRLLVAGDATDGLIGDDRTYLAILMPVRAVERPT